MPVLLLSLSPSLQFLDQYPSPDDIHHIMSDRRASPLLSERVRNNQRAQNPLLGSLFGVLRVVFLRTELHFTQLLLINNRRRMVDHSLRNEVISLILMNPSKT
jgi:hypothetical protein